MQPRGVGPARSVRATARPARSRGCRRPLREAARNSASDADTVAARSARRPTAPPRRRQAHPAKHFRHRASPPGTPRRSSASPARWSPGQNRSVIGAARGNAGTRSRRRPATGCRTAARARRPPAIRVSRRSFGQRREQWLGRQLLAGQVGAGEQPIEQAAGEYRDREERRRACLCNTGFHGGEACIGPRRRCWPGPSR